MGYNLYIGKEGDHTTYTIIYILGKWEIIQPILYWERGRPYILGKRETIQPIIYILGKREIIQPILYWERGRPYIGKEGDHTPYLYIGKEGDHTTYILGKMETIEPIYWKIGRPYNYICN